MQNIWTNFAHNKDFSASNPLVENIVCPLINHGLIICTGNDAKQFLQGQLTCDLNEITQSHSSLFAYCDQKGRVLLTGQILKFKESYLLIIPRELVDLALVELKKFILRSQVQLEIAQWFQLGIKLHENAVALPFELPEKINEVVANDLIIIRSPGTFNRYQIIGDIEKLEACWAQLEKNLVQTSSEAWNLLDIISSIPSLTQATTGLFTPHSLNLHLLNAISFKKGCYRGQEIVARMHYLGKSKQQLYRLEIESKKKPEIGEGLINTENKIIGNIINIYENSPNHYQGLAVLIAGEDKITNFTSTTVKQAVT